MNALVIAPIVEGHGEVEAVPILLRRTGAELLRAPGIIVLKPVRRPRTKLIRPERVSQGRRWNIEELRRAVRFAMEKLKDADRPNARHLVLLIVDAEDDCSKDLALEVNAEMDGWRTQVDFAVVLPTTCYETWFAAAARSLSGFLGVGSEGDTLTDPESRRCGKKWVSDRMLGHGYKETVDQPRLTANMNLELCRRHSPSFDKLCRELEKRVDQEPR